LLRIVEAFDNMNSFDVSSWWYLLCATAAFNVLAWTLSVAVVRRDQASMPADAYIDCRRQLILSAIYVFGCAFRSAHPVFDIPRLCLINGWLSSVVVGRSVATIAELSFVAQWALLFRQCAKHSGWRLAKLIPVLIVPLIAIAEICSWYSVLTTSNAGHVVEEAIWGSTAALMVIGMVLVRARWTGARRKVLVGWCVVGVAYVAFMFLHDVPMYWSRWMADEAHNRQYLSLEQGLVDVADRRVVSHSWQDWKSEVAWMTLYFSVAVWISISLVHVSVRESKRGAVTTSAA
jgi:hypothetical protein